MGKNKNKKLFGRKVVEIIVFVIFGFFVGGIVGIVFFGFVGGIVGVKLGVIIGGV